jgi:hypothetical protein
MDLKLKNVLEAVLKLLQALGAHMRYLLENNQLTDDPHSRQLIDDVRDNCMNILNTMNTIERRIQARGLLPPEGE